LAVEWAKYGIRINAIAPGIIESSGTTDTARYGEGMLNIAQQIIPMKRVGTLREVTDCVLFLASPGASFITGITVYIDGAQSLSGDMGQISSQVIPPARPKL
jgi:NAD(P)-dependent dehydrogenase (short-subunit alcohol dehydrogenase family)